MKVAAPINPPPALSQNVIDVPSQKKIPLTNVVNIRKVVVTIPTHRKDNTKILNVGFR